MLRKFRWKCSLSSCLVLIATRLTIDTITNRTSQEIFNGEPIMTGPAAKQNDGRLQTEETILRHEEWQVLKEMDTALTTREKLFLKWFYELELPADEAADLLGISADNVIQLRSQVRKKMKGCIKQLI